MNKEHLLTFVRGMAWHDIAKPLYLGSRRHTGVGYALLLALGYPDEALVALSHSGPEHRLELYRRHQSPSADKLLPPYLALASPLDVLSSVTYSLEEESPPDLPNPSAQNPFSRLPLSDDELGLIARVGQAGQLNAEIFTEAFWGFVEEQRGQSLSVSENMGLDILQADAPGPSTDYRQVDDVINALKAVPKPNLWEKLQSWQLLFGERTYPAPNDTALWEHTRLSAVLAYVLYTNLANENRPFLRYGIRLTDKAVVGDDFYLELARCHQMKEQDIHPQVRDLLITHLGCHLVRVCFTGLQDLFDSAVRLDDLTGVRELLKPDDKTRPSLKTAFKRHFALALLKLSCPDATLADVDDGLSGSALADILPLSEGLFDAVYLVPDCYPRDAIENAALEAYHRAWDEIAAERVIKVIWGDFRGFAKVLGLTEWEGEVKAQLARLPLSVVVRPVGMPELEGDSFRKWMAAFGNQLLKTFKGIHGAVAVPRNQISEWLAQAEKERKEDIEVCDVCGANPADPEFNELVPVEPRLQTVVHRRGNEWERICRSCVGLRALAHGVRKAEPLERMIQPDGEGHIRVLVSEPKGEPKLPPGLLRGHLPLHGKEHKDLGAAFVRWREPGKSLDIFPTVSYAADNEGNVALLSLTATKALFGRYDYEPDSQIADRTSTDADHRRTYYRDMVEEARQKSPRRVKGMLEVRPHLARVMTRIRLLDKFYQALPGKIERWKEPIRTLALQAEYPLVRVLVPAARLSDALAALEASLAIDLFSAVWEGCEEETRRLLAAILPSLLLGAVVVFKQKQPLYLVLEAERLLLKRLGKADVAQIWGKPLGETEERRGTDAWAGLRLGLCDLRGTLAEKGPWQGQVLWRDLGNTIDLEKAVDRVTVLRKGVLSGDANLVPLAQALTYIRADRIGLPAGTARQLCQESLFRPVLFLKHLTREGVR